MLKIEIIVDDLGRIAILCEPKRMPLTKILGHIEYAKALLIKQAEDSKVIIPVGENGE